VGIGDLGRGYWDPKRKLVEPEFFSEIFKALICKKCYALFCILKLF